MHDSTIGYPGEGPTNTTWHQPSAATREYTPGTFATFKEQKKTNPLQMFFNPTEDCHVNMIYLHTWALQNQWEYIDYNNSWLLRRGPCILNINIDSIEQCRQHETANIEQCQQYETANIQQCQQYETANIEQCQQYETIIRVNY